MLHCQMMRDVEASEKKKKMLPYFCEENYTGKIVKEVSNINNGMHSSHHLWSDATPRYATPAHV